MRDSDATAHATADERARRIETQLSRAGLGLVPRMGRRVSDRLFDRLLHLLAIRHPRAFTAFRAMPDACLLIEPVDTPMAFLLRVGPNLSLRALRRGAAAPGDVGGVTADAVVRGPYARLLDLLEGRIDGDALFFRRELTIAGDTALILALRNTLDGEEMDLLADAMSFAGPLAHALPVLRRNAGSILDWLDAARRLLPPPLRRGLARVEARLPGLAPAPEA
ncbi:SCP2 domain-containing protein [Azospirillum doebereinerae]|uniref:ubiquinone anaerobic biosynthesis accessory factor UbiT n=1 Tax=Azospirillum doebereinerae TaxID=92933 RepID=UPI001EE4EF5B|nr:SCP2 sterol-binding domain-containing protein [Azospirillum doebereinerae]MCG5238726.1 SCP2 sterol-binding domain-containing protein [Azospirillum doebereinerae]